MRLKTAAAILAYKAKVNTSISLVRTSLAIFASSFAALERNEVLRAPLDGSRLGSAVHELIQDLLCRGVRRPTTEELLAAVASHPVLDRVVVHRLRAHQDLFLAASVYFNRFLREEWELLGVEVVHSAGRFDIAWRRPDRRVIADELKTTKANLDTSEFRAKLDADRAAAIESYGDDFAYLRVLVLSDGPGRSFRLGRDGARLPIDPGT